LVVIYDACTCMVPPPSNVAGPVLGFLFRMCRCPAVSFIFIYYLQLVLVENHNASIVRVGGEREVDVDLVRLHRPVFVCVVEFGALQACRDTQNVPDDGVVGFSNRGEKSRVLLVLDAVEL
jgi:hypothetical protein